MTASESQTGSRDKPSPYWVAPLVCFVLILTCHCWRLGSVPMAGTEGNRALPAHLMVATGQWLVPMYYSQTYLRKPVLHYWVLAAAEKLSGGTTSEWTYRLPSAIGSALLAAFLAGMGRRWFGPPADWIAGLAFFCLVALWSQSRSADIDSLNTTATVIAGCALLHLGFGPDGRSRLLWSLVAGIAFGAMLLFKGPGGVPVIIGALVGGSWAARKWRWLAHPFTWGPILLGLILAGVWAIAVWIAIDSGRIPPDPTGLTEAGGRLMVLRKIPLALMTSLEVWAYTIPVGLAALLVPRLVRHAKAEKGRPGRVLGGGFYSRLAAVTGTWLGALLVFAVNGIDNPRYTYPAMPLMALIVAGVGVAWAHGELPRWTGKATTYVVYLFAPLACLLHVVLSIRLWGYQPVRAALAASFVLIIVGTLAWIRAVHTCVSLRTLAWAIPVFVALYIPVASHKMAKSEARSAAAGGRQVREIVPEDESFCVGYIHNKPEFFLYAQRSVEILGLEAMRDTIDLRKPCWMVLRPHELQAWERRYPDRIVSKLKLDVPRYDWHLVRYEPGGDESLQ